VSGQASPRLEEPLEFNHFAVVVAAGTSTDELRTALAEIGEPTEDLRHVFVDPAWVLDEGGEVARSLEWQRQWDAMVEFAASRGWTDSAGRVRAHVEPDPAG
jgi:hypothetical protein